MAMSLEPQSRAQRKLIAAARTSAAHLPPTLPPAWFLTDPARTPDPAAIARALPAGFGVIYRHFGAADRESVALTLAGICAHRGLAFLVAADPELAAEMGANGVHWPFKLRSEARRWQTRFAVQTVSAHSGRELRAAAGLPVDAALVSAVFASQSRSAGAPLGSLRFRNLVKGAGLPVYALGGITPENAGAIAGMAGFAAVDGMAAFGPQIRT
ncbi:MAG: thiamine phosphate synthase [Hyphomonas sp.]|nr:thiamine phosphate synthase [Hyphomonas sp.]